MTMYRMEIVFELEKDYETVSDMLESASELGQFEAAVDVHGDCDLSDLIPDLED